MSEFELELMKQLLLDPDAVLTSALAAKFSKELTHPTEIEIKEFTLLRAKLRHKMLLSSLRVDHRYD